MRRRLLLIAAGALLAPPLGGAQQPRGLHRVGLAFTTSSVAEMAGPNPDHPGARAFVRELRALGYLEGQNLVLERRSAEGRFERFSDILGELVTKTDVIAVTGDDLALRASQITRTVPIVMISGRYPVELGIVQSLSRPGANVTGLTVNPGPDIEAKRLELLRTLLPKLSRVAFLGRKTEWENPLGESVRAAAQAVGITLLLAEHTPDDYEKAFALIAGTRSEGLFVANSSPNFGHRRAIVGFAVKHRLPGAYPNREFVDAGGLLSYGNNAPDLFRRAAIYVDRILRGAKPSDLPVEQPTKFELIVNMKAAAALGVSVPQALLLRADEVIR